MLLQDVPGQVFIAAQLTQPLSRLSDIEAYIIQHPE
jgi:hypothetical protein